MARPSALVVVVLTLITSSSGGLLDPKKTVHVTNKLEGGLDLTLHCKSKDDDLGQHVLRPNQAYEFRFRMNWWASTRFYCSFQWAPAEFKWFDIYVARREQKEAALYKWIITKEKPCMFNFDTNKYDICYPWNKNPNALSRDTKIQTGT